MRQPLLVIAPLLLLTALPCIGVGAAISFPQIAKLKATDGAAGDGFGYAVAIGADFAIVGADGDDDLGSSSGAAYIFERDAGGQDAWGQVAKLTAPGGGAVELFGWSVAIRGERAIVGAPADSEAVGHAYLFERGVGGPEAWGTVATLVASDSAIGDNFGGSVALEGDVAVVGASGADGPGSSVNGAAYIFERDAGGPDAWGEVAKLTAAIACDDDASACGWPVDDFFGSSLSISSDTVVVGNSETSGGFAYIFRRHPGGVWRRVARPIPADFSGDDHYGRSVAVGGDTVLVGAFGDDDLANQAGAAYVFEPDPGGLHPWAERAKLTAPDGEREDWFGASVALDGDTAAIGVPHDGEERGAAYVLRRDAGGANAWGAVAHLLAPDGEDYDIFGHSVAISGSTVIAGAYGDDDLGTEAGAAYIFQATREDPPLALSRSDPSALAPDGRQSPQRTVGLYSALETALQFAGPPLTELDTEPGLGDAPPLPADARSGVSFGGQEDLGLMPAAARSPVVGQPTNSAPHHAPNEARLLCIQFLEEFTSFCDGLELSVTGGTIGGFWRNSDCALTDIVVAGTLQDDRLLVRCDALKDPCPVGASWGWILDLPLDGTLDMLQLDGLWNAWIDEMPYTTSAGPCPF